MTSAIIGQSDSGFLDRLHENHWKVQANLDVTFDIEITNNILDTSNKLLLGDYADKKSRRQIIFIDENAFYYYGKKIEHYYKHHDVELVIEPLRVSEEIKSIDTIITIVEKLEEFKLLRRSQPVIAMGGGVLLDLVGFAASLYRRGVPYIRVPTNLMALIDASIGAKTGINYKDRRNRLGTYFPPVKAYLDQSFLQTVSERDLSNGFGEIVKMAVIKDRTLFDLLLQNGPSVLENKFQFSLQSQQIVERSVHGMLEELAPNLWERVLERSVDFGHTFSPLAEMRSLPELMHGEMVALDVLFSCYISNNRGYLPINQLHQVRTLIKNLKLPTFHRTFADVALLIEAIEDTTLHRNGQQRLPLPKEIGKFTFVNDVTKDEILAASKRMRADS